MKKIFIISGKAESGKNVVAEYIKEYYAEKKIKVIITSFAKYLKIYAKEIINWNGNENDKPRDFLQTIGIELIKEKIDAKFLIKRMLDDLKVYDHYFDMAVITDARFKEEITAIKNNYANVITIYVERDKSSLTPKQKKHVTETALDDYHNYKYKITNNDNKKELKNKVIDILKEVK